MTRYSADLSENPLNYFWLFWGHFPSCGNNTIVVSQTITTVGTIIFLVLYKDSLYYLIDFYKGITFTRFLTDLRRVTLHRFFSLLDNY